MAAVGAMDDQANRASCIDACCNYCVSSKPETALVFKSSKARLSEEWENKLEGIVVTEEAAFLRSHLCLLAEGHPRFEMIRHDITFPLHIEADAIYNLPCPASPIHYQYDPIQTTQTSVHGANNMLGLAKRILLARAYLNSVPYPDEETEGSKFELYHL